LPAHDHKAPATVAPGRAVRDAVRVVPRDRTGVLLTHVNVQSHGPGSDGLAHRPGTPALATTHLLRSMPMRGTTPEIAALLVCLWGIAALLVAVIHSGGRGGVRFRSGDRILSCCAAGMQQRVFLERFLAGRMTSPGWRFGSRSGRRGPPPDDPEPLRDGLRHDAMTCSGPPDGTVPRPPARAGVSGQRRR
jgi:hypothetical protein